MDTTMEKSTSALSSSLLRPDAPTFLPSSAAATTTTTTNVKYVLSGDTEPDNHKNSRVRNHRFDRQSRNQKQKTIRTKKSQRQRQRRREETNETIKQDPNIQNTRDIEHELDSVGNSNKNRSKNGDHSRRLKTKYNRKSRQRKQHPMAMDESRPKSKNTNGKNNATQPRKEVSIRRQMYDDNDHNNNTSKDELELASSLSFPALMGDQFSFSSSARHNIEQSIWTSLTDIREVREGQLQHDHSKEQQQASEDKETMRWQNGLDRLTSHDRKSKQFRFGHRTHEFLSWDENEKEEENEDTASKDHEMKQYAAIGNNAVRSPSQMAQGGNDFIGSDKRIFNMNRLRDRWWMAVADQQRRFQHQQVEELEQEQDKSSCCVDASREIKYYDEGENLQTSDSDDNVKDYSISKISSGNQNDEIHLSDLQQKVKNSVPLYHGTEKKIKLLDLIIEQNDNQALRDMIELTWHTENENQPFHTHVVMGRNSGHIEANRMPSLETLEEDRIEENGIDLVEHAITILIRRNHPNLLRTILSITRGTVPLNSKPLIQAARLGHEECASIILSTQEKGPTMLFLDDTDGNTALHYCCRENGKKAMLLTLLKQVTGNTKRKRQQLSKLVTAQNKNFQTPLHIACQSGRNDLVEVFLTTCKSPLLFKLISIEDFKHQTPLLCAVSNNSCDVVLSLLMWRRNHDHQRRNQSQIFSATRDLYTNSDNQNQISQVNKAQNMKCPLVWAAKIGNLEMIDLLIQFGDQTGTFYQLTDALLTLLQSDVPDEIKLKGSNSLILAGGNPFQEVIDPELIDGEKTTSISVATKAASDDTVRFIISTALQLVDKRQLVRRRDPILQQQPEAFFRTLESKEYSEANRAIRNALIETLFRAYSNRKHSDFSKAIVLYEQIGKVQEEYLIQLQNSLRNGTMTSGVHQSKKWCFLATYRHATNAALYEGLKLDCRDCDRSVFAQNSLRLLKLPWVQNEFNKAECFCPWMSRNAEKSHTPPDLLTKDLLTLITNDGSRFLVHAPIVSEKSGKLSSALRFAQMKSGEHSLAEVINLEVAIAPDFCKLLIQHMYHGSICFGWPNLKNSDMCRYLLELMLIAEEFLIPSLVQEIEMRLMSSAPLRCFCWDCCQAFRCTSSNDGKNEAQCLFVISSSSRLVNRDTAMDVLSLTDYIGGLDYNIFMAPIILKPEIMWANYDKEVRKQKFWKVNKALAFLRNVAIIAILKEFAYVVKSPDFLLTSEGDRRKDSQKQILLQICLDELRNNSAITMDGSTHIEKPMNVNRKG